jgi:hypothetical protein
VARNQTPGRRRVEIEMTEGVAARLDALRAKFGRTMREEIELACTRHLDSPVPLIPSMTVENKSGKVGGDA